MTDQDRIFQANYKLPNGDLINVYGRDPNEFEAALSRVNNMAQVIVETGNALRAVGVVADAFQSPEPRPDFAPPAQQQYQQPAQQAAPQQAGAAPSPQCKHGARALKEGTSKAGKAYSGWMCQSRDRQDQCEPIWNRG